MSETVRTDPPLTGSETEVLVGFLDFHRATLLLKTDGLGSEDLRRAPGPGPMTLAGLLKHLAYVEHWWFNQVLAGNPPAEPWASVDWSADRDWEWHSALTDSPEALRALHAEAVARSRRLLAEALARPEALGATSAAPGRSDPRPGFSLRWILVHMVEEYARHNGHADLLREAIDGQVGE